MCLEILIITPYLSVKMKELKMEFMYWKMFH